MDFPEKYERIPFSGCWLWTGGVTWNGYGRIRVNGQYRQAHRFSWESHVGAIPNGLYVCHRCDVPACVNPAHLFVGTAKDNAHDCIEKGRNAVLDNGDQRGEKNRNARLTIIQVRDIRTARLTKSGFSRLYGVSRKAVKKIMDGKAWVGIV